MAMMLGEATARITLDISDLEGKSAQAQGILSNLDGVAGKTTGGMSKLTQGFMAFGAVAIPAMIAGISTAIDLEQAMANVNATLGGLDPGALDALEQGFLDIGAASQFSAVEVAAVGDEIARAGFATDDIVGMTRAVVDLSQATGTDLMTSVSGVTSVMQIWSPAIVDSTIALTDASRAADIFTVAANASSADVQDIIAGMRNFGPTAASIGVGFDEASGAIAYFTNYGLKAANAGVSMTRAIQNLQDPTAEAATLMQELGINVFDMQGNFVGLPTLFDQLHVAMADMTPEARNMALTTLFGAEAIDVMTVAAMTGGDPLRMILGLMEDTGVAAEQSALRMDTLKAQFGELVESITNLLARMASGLIPAMRMFVDFANAVVNALSRIPEPVLAVIGAITALAAAFATLRGAAAGLNVLQRLTGIAIPGAGLLAGLATPLLVIAGVVATAAAAIKLNLFGIGDAVAKFTSIWNNLADSAANNSISRFLIALGQALQTFDIERLNTIGRGLDALGKGVNAFFDGFRGPGNKEMESTTKTFEGFAELAEDGVTWKVKSEDGDELGEIIDSWDNADGTTTVRIKTKGGEVLETTIDMATGFVEGEYEVEVEVETKDGRKALDRLQDGFDAMTKSLEKSMFPALAAFPRAASRAIDSIRTFTEGFRMAREAGADPLEASLRALGMTIPQLSDVSARLEMGWRDLKDTFQDFRDRGVGPVSSALLALGASVPPLETAMRGLAGVTENIGDAFLAGVRGDWSQVFEELGMAARGAWVFVQGLGSAIGTVAINIGNWVLGQIPDIWAWLQDTVVPAIGAGALWLWDALVNIGSWAKGIVSDIWPYVTQWASDAISGIASAAGTLWGVLVNIGSWAKGIVSDLWPYVSMWASEALSGISSAAGTLWGVLVNIGSWAKGIVSDLAPYVAMWASEAVAGITSAAATVWDVLVNIGSWIISEGDSLIEKIDTFIFGEAGNREFEIPVINVTVGRVHVLPFGDKIQEGIDAAVTAWETAQAIHARIEQINARVNSAKVEGGGGGGGGGFIGYLRDEIQKEIDHASKTWDFILDINTVVNAEVKDPDSTFNKVADAIERMAGGWGMIHGGEVDWSFILGEPEVLGFGLIDAAVWFDQHVYGPIEDGFNSIKDKFTFEIPDIDIKWPEPPDAPDWLKQLFTDPVGWVKDQVGFGGSGDGGSGIVGPEVPEGFKWQGTLIDFGPGEGPTLDDLRGVINSIMGAGRDLIQSKAAEWGTALQSGTATLGTQLATSMAGVQMAMTTSLSTIGMSIGTQAATWGTNLATGLQSLTTTSTTAFLGMQLGIATSMATIGSTITTQAASWGAALTTGMATMTASATSAMATIGTVIQGGMAIATAAVTAGGAAMSSAMSSAGAAMSSAAASAAATTASVLQAGMAIATSAVASAAGQWPGIIAAAGGAMYAAGYSTGAAAGQGVVAGLLSMLGAVQAAANQIVSTALGAMSAAAAIASPSKITTYYGQMIGQGLVHGMNGMRPAVASAGMAMMAAATPAPSPYMPATGAMGGGVSNSSTTVIDLSGSTFHNTSRDEMNFWAAQDLLPTIEQTMSRQRIAKGMTR